MLDMLITSSFQSGLLRPHRKSKTRILSLFFDLTAVTNCNSGWQQVFLTDALQELLGAIQARHRHLRNSRQEQKERVAESDPRVQLAASHHYGFRWPAVRPNLAGHYFTAVATELKVVFRLVPTSFTAVMITTEMSSAIRPYSIAVAPLSSCVMKECKNL